MPQNMIEHAYVDWGNNYILLSKIFEVSSSLIQIRLTHLGLNQI